MADRALVPYPPLERMAVVGDRRTAALIAADGTLCWMCLPHYDSTPVFGALLDADKGGFWRLGPVARCFGTQSYPWDAPCASTSWQTATGEVDLLDAMLWPADHRAPENIDRHVVLRRLRCTQGVVECVCHLAAVDDFKAALTPAQRSGQAVAFDGRERLGLWCSHPLSLTDDRVSTRIRLQAGEQLWCAFGPGEADRSWTVELAKAAMEDTVEYWHAWTRRLHNTHPRVAASARLVHLLTFAPTGAVVAAPTMSLPERLGGERNYDYRFTWVRDASLSVALLARLGAAKDAGRFLDWLAERAVRRETPLQILYRIDGSRDMPVAERDDLLGYRGSHPVRTGNAAATMRELGSFGYLTNCMKVYLDHGGPWRPEYTALLERVADATAAHWREPGSGIWELMPPQDFVISKVMNWVALDRALDIATRLRCLTANLDRWRQARDDIREDVLSRGWSEPMRSFRQRYGADTVDAALLLMPIVGFLPASDERIAATVARIVDRLVINDLVQRFVAGETPGQSRLPEGEAEGSFLMCLFWLARVLALRGDTTRAAALLQRADELAGSLGLFAECADARDGRFLGNTPLLFSQVEYANARLALDPASPH